MATVRLADYRPAPFLIAHTQLGVQLHADHALVEAELAFEPNPAAAWGPLELRGEGLELLGLWLDEAPLTPPAYRQEPGLLVLEQPPQRPFRLRSLVRIQPHANTSLAISGATMTCDDPAATASRWSHILDRPAVPHGAGWRVTLDNAALDFMPNNGPAGEGLAAIRLTGLNAPARSCGLDFLPETNQ
jgi:aminopeptidase N